MKELTNWYNLIKLFLRKRTAGVLKVMKFLFESAGLLAFVLYIYEANVGNLKIDINTIENEKGFFVNTNVVNDNVFGKKINYAVIFIAKYDMNSCEKNELVRTNFREKELKAGCSLMLLNDISENTVYQDSFAIIPLPFYYLEQTNIGNEDLELKVKIEGDKLCSGLYDVRFYIFYNRMTNWNRVTQDLLIID